jgi:DMSO/TMAO reductase YedYZ molybdopterin-dependent catalytic subunit
VIDVKKEHKAATWIEGKDTRMTVLSEAPLVLETPVRLLAGQRITDKQVLFVRNIQDLGEGLTLEPRPIEGWEIELVGLINPWRVVIRAEDLLKMEQAEYEMVLQCSGNGRSQYIGIPGTPWGQGGVGNVRFAGVPLSAVLRKHNVKVDSQVKYVTAEGQDLPMGLEKPDYEHSLPLADVLEKSILPSNSTGRLCRACTAGPCVW